MASRSGVRPECCSGAGSSCAWALHKAALTSSTSRQALSLLDAIVSLQGKRRDRGRPMSVKCDHGASAAAARTSAAATAVAADRSPVRHLLVWQLRNPGPHVFAAGHACWQHAQCAQDAPGCCRRPPPAKLKWEVPSQRVALQFEAPGTQHVAPTRRLCDDSLNHHHLMQPARLLLLPMLEPSAQCRKWA